ncbi:MAG: 4a-hydroxytetrahydrobiopterin dehydratase [Pseudomonadota bacterium]
MSEASISAENLRQRQCEPCEGGVEPLSAAQCAELMPSLDTDWRLVDDGTVLARDVKFAGYNRVLSFVNALGWIANTEGHHPDIRFGYGYCNIVWTTHAISGLSVNDFICAAKTDALLTGV